MCLLACVVAGALVAVGLSRPTLAPAAAAAAPLQFTAYVGPGDPTGLRTTAGELDYTPTTASDYFNDESWSGISDDTWAIDRGRTSGIG